MKSATTKLAQLIIKRKKVAGSYHENWKPNYRFSCLTGNAQLTIIFLKLFEIEQDRLFYQAALISFLPVINNQRKSGLAGVGGGVPGSAPVWGPYFRFRYPNWGVKFFLDAYLHFYKISKSAT